MSKVKKLFDYLIQENWTILTDDSKVIPQSIKERYTNIDKAYEAFLTSFSLCTSSSDEVWFLSVDDFNESDECAFRWNEFEIMSLETTDDPKYKKQIIEFWDNHLPILYSVEDGYTYYAFETDTGAITVGYEPEFEDVQVVASSFTEFIDKIMNKEIIL